MSFWKNLFKKTETKIEVVGVLDAFTVDPYTGERVLEGERNVFKEYYVDDGTVKRVFANTRGNEVAEFDPKVFSDTGKFLRIL
jgi:hypothetical protein